jgi:glycosyltransferase involved in cell wall biosynthesis
MAGPLVSIVTPSFNQGQFIGRTIESVLGQSYPHIEYCVIDGGSTDTTLDVLRSYGSKLMWCSEPDRGQTHAINKGFAQSQGSIRAYLNSDDTLIPNAVETIVDLFRRDPTVSLYYGDAHYIDADDRITGLYVTAEYSFDRLMHDCCICQPAAFWTAEIAKKVGPFDESLHFVMDYDYWIRIDRAFGRIRHAPVILANSRLYSTTKTLAHRREIYNEIFAICTRHVGYVSRSYVEGYYHHRLDEGPELLFRSLGRFSKLAGSGGGAEAGESIKSLTAAELADKIDYYERLDQRTTMAAGRRSSILREIDRRRVILDEMRPSNIQKIKEDEVKMIEATAAKVKKAS